MNIKRFIARNAQEAIRMVKRDMGPEAVILKTRTILEDSGRSNQKIEVTAAVDYDAPVVISNDTNPAHEGWRQRLERELGEIKEALLCADAGRTMTPEIYYNQELKSRYMNFKTFGLRSEIIRGLMNEGNENTEVASSHQLKESLSKVLSRINIKGDGRDNEGRKIYSFIGPTGVGKTTTLAKLAAINAMQQGKKAALITLDTFRIAAVAQLQTYAGIMGIPLDVAASSDDLQKAIQKHSDCDRIFIDTAGRSPNRDQDINELRDLLNVPEKIHLYLVLSATTQYKNLINAEKRFGALPYQSYIFTKLDETQDASTMINFLISRQKPVTYFTTGQHVPEDIEIASRKKLASLLLAGIREMPNNSMNKENNNGPSYRP
ncbi:MAG: flagellar biosynthesis protein FlhF [Deltaproteobacteria bacterium]|nr:flagellar biosynthesis protein FlhF [Deltaproteobacteria bacterium]